MNKFKSSVCLATFCVCGDEYCTRKSQVLVALAGRLALGHVFFGCQHKYRTLLCLWCTRGLPCDSPRDRMTQVQFGAVCVLRGQRSGQKKTALHTAPDVRATGTTSAHRYLHCLDDTSPIRNSCKPFGRWISLQFRVAALFARRTRRFRFLQQ